MIANVISQEGHSIVGFVLFEAKSDKEITREDAKIEQDKLGFHPDGYDFYAFSCKQMEDGTFIAQWRCAASCD